MIDRAKLALEMSKLSDREVVAYWNVAQMGMKTIQTDPTHNQTIAAVASEELTRREIKHEHGKLINSYVRHFAPVGIDRPICGNKTDPTDTITNHYDLTTCPNCRQLIPAKN